MCASGLGLIEWRMGGIVNWYYIYQTLENNFGSIKLAEEGREARKRGKTIFRSLEFCGWCEK